MGLQFHTAKASIAPLLVLTTALAGVIQSSGADSALTNWQAASSCFQRAGELIAQKEYSRAQNQLAAGATNLAPGYQPMASRLILQLEAAFNKPAADESERLDRLADVCMSLHAYTQAAQLKAAAQAKEAPAKDAQAKDAQAKDTKDAEADESEDDLRAWRLFETSRFNEAIAEYKRKLADAPVSTFQEYYQKQIDLIQRRTASPNDVAVALEFVRGHYLAGFEAPGDLLCALKELNRVLPYAQKASDGLAVHRLIIQCLASCNDESGRDAWEDKMLTDYKFNQDTCAEVYLNRGIRAYAAKKYPAALALFLKVCQDYPNSEYYGDAQYNAGSTLQDQEKYDQAIQEFSKIFNSKVDDYKLTPGTSEDYKLYRHKSALRISECYELKKDYQRALDFAELARTQYKPLSWCHTCLQTSKDALERRIAELQNRLHPKEDGKSP
jgi:tetratricopeptide (TPR) repeat protein